jgi:hypothetical protein
MAPIVHGLELEYYGQINFVYLDVDDPRNDQFKRALSYRVQPHFFLLDGDGNILNQWLGRVSSEDLKEAFDAVTSQ